MWHIIVICINFKCVAPIQLIAVHSRADFLASVGGSNPHLILEVAMLSMYQHDVY